MSSLFTLRRPKESPKAGWSLGSSTAGAALQLLRLGPVVILVLLVVVIGAVQPIFLERQNLQNVLVQTTPIAILALGQLFVIVSRGIDISVGSTLGLSTVTGALVASHLHVGTAVTIVAIIATGAAVGIVNGLLITKVGIRNPLIVTLGMLNVALGLALVLSDGRAVAGIPIGVQDLAIGSVAGIPTPFVITLVLALLAFTLGRLTQWGRWIYAMGGNPEAARRAGIPTDRVTMFVYVLSGIAAGCAAVIVAGRLGSGFPRAGDLSELDSIAAVIIGGASLYGGRGGVMAALIGALVIGTLRNGLNIIGVDPDLQYVAVGIVVILAVGLDILRTRVENRIRLAQSRDAAAAA